MAPSKQSLRGHAAKVARKIEICPVCKAENSMFLYMGGHLGILYKCKKCGYVGPIILEKDENKSK